ncbi:Protein of unknown function [Allopseudospirillum japonicum]|uniref:DUF2959 domain-containing protein n=1 Tax=Allopseudospirillum japonicum TaxID=64971 RepID=A0A1H6SL24_9GAMM|nr:DUF2959 domain-containing protein [Allopseudospirillum japonicum]SEI65597.1 Protein of unknown function [Allopseudospirillum japonicum]
MKYAKRLLMTTGLAIVLSGTSFPSYALGLTDNALYYGMMEQFGVPKRDIMVSRVEDARDTQTEAGEQFKSALERFASIVNLPPSELQQIYTSLNDEYEMSLAAAERVSARIAAIQGVSEALFNEWEEELASFQNAKYRQASERSLRETRRRYQAMLTAMQKAEASMQPVLTTLRDNVLFLKHNLNAQAIGALKAEFAGLETNIQHLIRNMQASIEHSNQFIQEVNAQTVAE